MSQITNKTKQNRLLYFLNPYIYALFLMAWFVSGCDSELPKQPHVYPDSGSPQAKLYLEKCGRCHAAPLPTAHTARVWPSVLDRMQVRMKAKSTTPLTREEMSIILGYLQQNAAKLEQNKMTQ